MSLSAERPGHWAAVVAYLREGHRAWKERDVGYGVQVEEALGLSPMEGHSFIQYLEGLGLAQYDSAANAVGAFHLLPKGLAVAEGLPSLDRVLSAQTVAIVNVQGPTEPEKSTALASVHETTIKYAVERGLDWTLKSLPHLYRLARAKWPWLPQLGPEDPAI
jgi:hypothetical protein